MKDGKTKRLRQKTFVFFAASQLLAVILIIALAEIGMMIARRHIREKYDVVIQSKCPDDLGTPRAEKGPNFFIFAVGDSHTWGVGAVPDKSYPKQFMNLICERQADALPDLTIVARPGWNSAQALTGLKSAMGINPADPADTGLEQRIDLMVICVGKNNDHNLLGVEYFNAAVDQVPDSVALERLLEKSGAYQLSKITRSRIRQLLTKDIKAIAESTCVLCREDEPFLRQWLEHDYREMIMLGRAKGARIVLMNYFEIVDYVDETMMEIAESDKDLIFVDNHNFNLPPPYYTKPFQAPCTHPNEKGYARIATHLYDSLEAQGWLPGYP